MELPFKSIGGIEKTIKEANQYREAKELLKCLAKELPTPVKLNKWLEIDKEMADRPVDMLPTIFQRVVQWNFGWGLGLVPLPIIKPNQLLNHQKLRESAIWGAFAKLLVNPEYVERVVVLFKLNRLGVWVMHNIGAPSSGTYVCIPAQQTGKSNITIEPMDQWAERTFA